MGVTELFVLGMGGALVYLMLFLRDRERSEVYQRAARRAGLTAVEISGRMGWNARLTGRAGQLEVRIESYQHGKNERGTLVVVGGLNHGAYALTIRAEGVTSAIEKTLGERELVLGDEAFDRAAYLQGAPALVRAIFDVEARRLMRPLLEGEWRVAGRSGSTKLSVRTHVSDSELEVEIRESVFGNTLQALPDALPTIVDLAKRLARPEDLAAAVAANTRREPVPAVRLGNLQLLAREHRQHAATRDTLLAALEDEEPAVRVQAAIFAGPEGRAVLLDSATRAGIPDGVAARAITALGGEFPLAEAIERLRRSSESETTALPRACIEVIGCSRAPEAVAALAEVLAGGSEELAVAAADGLGTTPDEAAERALVAALEHDAAKLRLAAAGALGRIGTPSAVAPLRDCAAAHTFDGALRRAARQAIAEIQARVSGAAPGQLSLAAGESGQVSLAEEDRRGEVALATERAEPGTK